MWCVRPVLFVLRLPETIDDLVHGKGDVPDPLERFVGELFHPGFVTARRTGAKGQVKGSYTSTIPRAADSKEQREGQREPMLPTRCGFSINGKFD